MEQENTFIEIEEDDELSEEELDLHTLEYKRFYNPHFDRNQQLLIKGDIVHLVGAPPFIFAMWKGANESLHNQDYDGFSPIPLPDFGKSRPLVGTLVQLADQEIRTGQWLMRLTRPQSVFVSVGDLVTETDHLYVSAQWLERP